MPSHDVTQGTELTNCLQKMPQLVDHIIFVNGEMHKLFTYMPKQQPTLQLLLEIGIFTVVTTTQKNHFKQVLLMNKDTNIYWQISASSSKSLLATDDMSPTFLRSLLYSETN